MRKMRNQQKEHCVEKPELHATAAAAALAEAVKSAEQSAGKPVAEAESDRAGTPTSIAGEVSPGWRDYALRAATLVVALGLGWAGGSDAFSSTKRAGERAPDWTAAAAAIRDNQDDVARLTGDVQALKAALEASQDKGDGAKAPTVDQYGPLMERFERLERASQESMSKLAHIVEASDRMERGAKDAHVKLAELTGRIEAVERHATAIKAAQLASADIAPQTGSVDAKAAPRKRIGEWILHDVDRGVALIENRRGQLREVVPGQVVPNAGRVESIERRGRTWVVVTSKGIIGVAY